MNKDEKAFIFSYDSTSNEWSQEALLQPSNFYPFMSSFYGSSIAISSNNTIAIAAPYEHSFQNTITNGPTSNKDISPDNSAVNSGAVYVYTRQ